MKYGSECNAVRMTSASFFIRVRDSYRRKRSLNASLRLVKLRSQFPIVSFTFDDFPRTAASAGGMILEQNMMRGTFYVSLGLMNREIPAGPAFSEEDLNRIVEKGHELGCHTFSHCHAWETTPSAFENSIIENKHALSKMLPGIAFRSFSYPIATPRPQTKERVAKHYSCARGGGEKINLHTVDANNLAACFLEKHRDKPDSIQRLIDENSRKQGWLIFATHDVACNPSPFGCRPDFFEKIVTCAGRSGATVLPVAEAWDMITKNADRVRA
jgi:peptidoglycan/xylan/chitin deacetylase (PgdA/CDA1 family)